MVEVKTRTSFGPECRRWIHARRPPCGNAACGESDGHERGDNGRDDCDPNADWGPGGCLREEGSVTRAEFRAFTFSPLIPLDATASRVPVGHPSWRIAPGFLAIEQGRRLRVANTGGRGHTFTEVVDYGGGFIAGLNGAPTPAIAVAPECAAIATDPNSSAAFTTGCTPT